MADINSYLDNITSSIKQLRQDLNDLQLEERPSIRSGLWASRPPNAGLRVSDRYFATDRVLEYFWDGTRWLTANLYYFSCAWIPGLVFPLTVSTSAVRADNPEAVSDIYLVQLTMSSSIAATYNASNFWTYQLFRIDNAGTVTGVGAAQTTWQTGRVVGNRYLNTFAINTQLTAANAAAFRIDLATSGAPGGITPNPPILAVRYVGV